MQIAAEPLSDEPAKSTEEIPQPNEEPRTTNSILQTQELASSKHAAVREQHGNTLIISTAYGHTSKIEISESRSAVFFVPDKLTKRDVAKLKKALEGVNLIIDSLIVEDQT